MTLRFIKLDVAFEIISVLTKEHANCIKDKYPYVDMRLTYCVRLLTY